jgi:hypothetical protein
MHFVALLVTAVFAFAAGWFLACYFVTTHLHRDIADLDAERRELEDEREELNRAWLTAAVVIPEQRVELDLGSHRRIPVA